MGDVSYERGDVVLQDTFEVEGDVWYIEVFVGHNPHSGRYMKYNLDVESGKPPFKPGTRDWLVNSNKASKFLDDAKLTKSRGMLKGSENLEDEEVDERARELAEMLVERLREEYESCGDVSSLDDVDLNL